MSEKLIDIQLGPEVTAVTSYALEQLKELNSQTTARANIHVQLYNKFWNSQYKPQDQLDAMGPAAYLWLKSAQENVEHLEALVVISNYIRPPESQVTIDDFLAQSHRIPRIPFVVDDAAKTVAMAPTPEGFDDWGNALPPPPPGPEEDPQQTPQEEPAPCP